MHLIGRGTNKLTVLNESKLSWKQWEVKVGQSNGPEKEAALQQVPLNFVSDAMSPEKSRPYKVLDSNSKTEAKNKILALLALGPITKKKILNITDLSSNELDEILTAHARPYDATDSFIADDKFPQKLLDGVQDKAFILKDMSYKELQPWKWQPYTLEERSMIIKNIHNALTRLGYLESHPLRKRICETPDNDSNNGFVRKPNLGGGLLMSRNKKSPYKRTLTDSPKTSTEPAKAPKVLGSPLKATKKRTSSSSNAEEEKGLRKKRLNSDSSVSSVNESEVSKDPPTDNSNYEKYERPSTVDNSEDICSHRTKTFQYYYDLANKFKQKYKEYEALYNCLKVASGGESESDKKQLLRLFELHNTLAEWKKKLWDYDTREKSKSAIMNLTKHKKANATRSTSSTPSSRSRQAFAPQKSRPTENHRNPVQHSDYSTSDAYLLKKKQVLRNIPKLSLDY